MKDGLNLPNHTARKLKVNETALRPCYLQDKRMSTSQLERELWHILPPGKTMIYQKSFDKKWKRSKEYFVEREDTLKTQTVESITSL